MLRASRHKGRKRMAQQGTVVPRGCSPSLGLRLSSLGQGERPRCGRTLGRKGGRSRGVPQAGPKRRCKQYLGGEAAREQGVEDARLKPGGGALPGAKSAIEDRRGRGR